MSDTQPRRELVQQPTKEASAAIAEFVKTGAWPKPGTIPACIRLGRSGFRA